MTFLSNKKLRLLKLLRIKDKLNYLIQKINLLNRISKKKFIPSNLN